MRARWGRTNNPLCEKTRSTGAELAGVHSIRWQYESKFRFVNNGRQWCYWCRKCWWVYSVHVAVKFPFQLLRCVCWLHDQTAMFSSSSGANNHLWARRYCSIVNKTAKLKIKTKTNADPRPRRGRLPAGVGFSTWSPDQEMVGSPAWRH